MEYWKILTTIHMKFIIFVYLNDSCDIDLKTSFLSKNPLQPLLLIINKNQDELFENSKNEIWQNIACNRSYLQQFLKCILKSREFVCPILRIVTLHRPGNFFSTLFFPCKLFLRYFYGLCINLFWCISLCSLTASVWIREWQLFLKSTSKHIYSASLCEYILNVHKLRPDP